jgi:hypothetical protein
VGPRCSFCATSAGPFGEFGRLFTVLMCAGCQVVRSGPAPEPAQLVVHAEGGRNKSAGRPLAALGSASRSLVEEPKEVFIVQQ